MSEGNLDVVRGSYEAFSTGDFAAVLEAMDSEVEWFEQESLPWGGTYRGHQEFSNHMQEFGSYFEEFRVEPQEYHDTDDRVVVRGRLAGRASGGEFEVGFVHTWRLRDGKVVGVDTCLDTAAVLKALGR